MAQSRSPRKSVPAAIGAAVLVLVGGYFGIDFATDSGAKSASEASSSATAITASSPAHKPSTARSPKTEPTAAGGFPSCPLSSLPAQAENTAADILAGGPFEHPDNDNARFGNYEGTLPRQSRNYYREYTVDTPGINHRGAKRIVTGGGTETDPEVWYYTDDHYESFCAIPDAEY